MGIMNWIGTPQFQALMDIEDPYAYREPHDEDPDVARALRDQGSLL